MNRIKSTFIYGAIIVVCCLSTYVIVKSEMKREAKKEQSCLK